MKFNYMSTEKVLEYVASLELTSIYDVLNLVGGMIENETVENYNIINDEIESLTSNDIINAEDVYKTDTFVTLCKLLDKYGFNPFLDNDNRLVIGVEHNPKHRDEYQINFDNDICVSIDVSIFNNPELSKFIDDFLFYTIESIIYQAFCK